MPALLKEILPFTVWKVTSDCFLHCHAKSNNHVGSGNYTRKLKKDDLLTVLGHGKEDFPFKINNNKMTVQADPRTILERMVFVERQVYESYVIRNKNTGEYLKDIISGNVLYDPLYSEAKKMNSLGTMKTYLLRRTGFEDMYVTNKPYYTRKDIVPYIAIADFWEIVLIDRYTQKELKTFDVESWHKICLYMAEQTVKYGYSIWEVFLKIDQKNNLSDYSHIFFSRFKGNKVALKSFDSMIKSVCGLGEYTRFKNEHRDVAVAFRDENTAVLARLQYDGGSPLEFIDLADVKKMVR